MNIIVRPAVESDSGFFYNLRGVGAYQRFSTSTFNTTFKDHDLWFQARLRSPVDILFLAYDESENDIGYVRFEPDSSICAFRLSFAIVPSELGKGYSKPMLQSAISKLKASSGTLDLICITASVHNLNIPSKKALESVGFRRLYEPQPLALESRSSSQNSDYSVYALHVEGL